MHDDRYRRGGVLCGERGSRAFGNDQFDPESNELLGELFKGPGPSFRVTSLNEQICALDPAKVAQRSTLPANLVRRLRLARCQPTDASRRFCRPPLTTDVSTRVKKPVMEWNQARRFIADQVRTIA
jgi:hypothetical protein